MTPRRAWTLLVLLAALTRGLQVLTEPAFLHPDALFQALEPAFRIVWGYGVRTWEFERGLRSWAWPGLLSAAMFPAQWLGLAGPGVGMGMAIAGARTLVAAIDVVMIVFAVRLAHDRGGPNAAVLTGAVLALHPAFFVMGAQPLIEVPATAALVVACERALGTARLGVGRAAVAGLALGLALGVRVQLAPAVLAWAACVAWAHHRGALTLERGAARALLFGVAGSVLAFGGLDWVTWGGPWSSSIAYLQYSFAEGTTAFGTMPADRYLTEAWAVFGPFSLVLLVLAALGARRSWPVVLIALAVFVPHQCVPYRVWRFIAPALPLLVIAAGVGFAVVCDRLAARQRIVQGALIVLALLELARAQYRNVPWSTTWLFSRGGALAIERSRGLNAAFVAVSEGPPPVAVAQAVLPAGGAPGYALLGYDVPVHNVLDAPITPAVATQVDVWIVADPQAEAPAGFAVWWEDPVAGVVVLRR